ncbi:MAG: NAD(P)-dependent oxidoreductase [Chloroflexi bacterium]|nr:NAD(P)-dependent oxidoreductase [Chloroflexota bacterium]
MRRVLITGAGGRIGSSLSVSLRDRYDLRLHYHRNMPEQPPVGDVVRADITRLEEVLPIVEGIDTIVHLAGEPSPSAPWESVRDRNIEGTYNVYEAARWAGVRRIIFATTNHVMGMYDRDRAWPVYARDPIRPDSLYGVSKAFGEALARHYYDLYGLSSICLRIGWFLPRPHNEVALFMWLSPRDCAQVVWRSIETSYPFGIFYAISRNARRHWDITDTIETLGYRPEDDAELYAEEIEGR